MRTQTIGFSASLLVHGAFGLLLYSLAMVVPEAPLPVVIDLSLLAGPQAPAPTPVASPVPRPPAPAMRAPAPAALQEVPDDEVVRQQVVQPRKRKRVVAKAAVIPEAVQLPAPVPALEAEVAVVREEELSAAVDQSPEAEAPDPLPQEALPATAQPAMRAEAGAALSEHGSSSSPAASGAGTTLTPEARWRQEHFSAIKEAIRKNMVYPVVARRNGWQGRVLVSFVICLDGRVEEIRIEESSGFSLLDKSAVTIIKQSAPFPSPPVRATLIVPIDYTLG